MIYRPKISCLLDDLIDRLDHARRYETYIVSLCPFHPDKRPSFMVYEDWYRCLSCGAEGKTENLLNKLNGHTVVRPQSNFKNPWSKWLKTQSLKDVLVSAWERGQSVYIRERHIPDKVQKKLGIGTKENWITFPITENNKIVGGIARRGDNNSSQSKYIVPAGQSPNLLYIPSKSLVEASETIYLTFGILDAISLFLVGLGAVSTTLGKKLDPSALDSYRKKIYIIPDKGEEKEAQFLASKLGWRGCVIYIDYPEGTKDCNDLLIKRILTRDYIEKESG